MQGEKLPTQVTGNIGMYYACYRLSKLGWNVMPTARNARGIDIVAYDSDGERFVGIQVKALTKRSAVALGSSRDKLIGDYWIIVTNARADPKTYILPTTEVKRMANPNGTAEARSFWLEMKDYEQDRFCEQWDQIRLIHD